ncbi:serine/threonine-protein kinase [Streptomyces sp. MP131-18]|uniref:serine/threonine protein kinase n=1 Tax=Streptomyces sp. MP131-18 TaxID=1857892 RepID=UPI00097BD261|nr:serine/threonine-protein kinase [Streptomyces sp. MP131-18]ONK14437.1 Serine/threonine-protein kinase StkP [Streptomyces sp. MP131-18]
MSSTQGTGGMLDAGTRLTTERDEQVTVKSLLGFGGQGEVYEVDTPGGPAALKWYFPQLADVHRWRILEALVDRAWGDDRFLWPRTIVADPSRESFGYVMDLRPERFHDLPALLRRDKAVAAATPRSLITTALNTVEAYKTLHEQGIAYRDISWGNVFFDPDNGDVLVCDNDNAVVEGESAGIEGTMNFMAPELVRRDQGVKPGIQTDLHSLAVLLFYLLMNHHPFDGALELRIHCLDEKAQRKLYGTEPVFVYDPVRTANRPVPGEQDTVIATWGVLPQVLRDLFIKTFTEGLTRPGERARESEWRDALSAVRDAIVPCATCGKENMTQPDGAAPACWKCRRPVDLPMRLELTAGKGKRRPQRHIRLNRGAELYPHHLHEDPERHDFGTPIGEVTPHPTTPGRFGLTNRSTWSWRVRRADGSQLEVPPGRTAALRPGLLLELGDGAEAVVRER